MMYYTETYRTTNAREAASVAVERGEKEAYVVTGSPIRVRKVTVTTVDKTAKALVAERRAL